MVVVAPSDCFCLNYCISATSNCSFADFLKLLHLEGPPLLSLFHTNSSSFDLLFFISRTECVLPSQIFLLLLIFALKQLSYAFLPWRKSCKTLDHTDQLATENWDCTYHLVNFIIGMVTWARGGKLWVCATQGGNFFSSPLSSMLVTEYTAGATPITFGFFAVIQVTLFNSYQLCLQKSYLTSEKKNLLPISPATTSKILKITRFNFQI